MGFKTTLLEDAVKCCCLLHVLLAYVLLALAVEKRKHLQNVHIDLVSVVTWALEMLGKESLGERAFLFEQWSPCVRR